jgi:transposase-like protein
VSETKIAVPFAASSPDPEVPAKPERRKFSAEDKKRILEEVDRATGHGGIGAVLRREGIYSSTSHTRLSLASSPPDRSAAERPEQSHKSAAACAQVET